uniref:Uncharacterized protein n=1 Tax=Meloidogyne enterolobii TaxID=390850 RepID=A0A6V7X415_MELEN|nr:unnamed protein product [Meloidogyne enterolobii]
MEFEQIIAQQKEILEKLFCLYKDLGELENTKDVQLIKNKLKKYNKEEIEEGILINENEINSLIEWRQSIVAKELFAEINIKNKQQNVVFKNKLIEGLKNSLLSRRRLYSLIGPINTSKLFELLKITFKASEYEKLDTLEFNEESSSESNSSEEAGEINKIKLDIAETPSEHPLEENPSSSGTKTKLSKKKRNQIKKTLALEDLNKGVDKDNKNEEEIVGNVVEGGVDLLEENG